MSTDLDVATTVEEVDRPTRAGHDAHLVPSALADPWGVARRVDGRFEPAPADGAAR